MTPRRPPSGSAVRAPAREVVEEDVVQGGAHPLLNRAALGEVDLRHTGVVPDVEDTADLIGETTPGPA